MDVDIHSNAKGLSPSDIRSKEGHFWSHSFDLAQFFNCFGNVTIVVVNEILCCFSKVSTRGCEPPSLPVWVYEPRFTVVEAHWEDENLQFLFWCVKDVLWRTSVSSQILHCCCSHLTRLSGPELLMWGSATHLIPSLAGEHQRYEYLEPLNNFRSIPIR